MMLCAPGDRIPWAGSSTPGRRHDAQIDGKSTTTNRFSSVALFPNYKFCVCVMLDFTCRTWLKRGSRRVDSRVYATHP